VPFASLAQERFLFAHHPSIAQSFVAHARQQGVPFIQPGGHQPYHGSSASHPGPALDAMRKGTLLDGSHPHDAMRMVQKQSRRPRTLLDSLGR